MNTDRYNLSHVIGKDVVNSALRSPEVLWMHSRKICFQEMLNCFASRMLTFACRGTWREKYVCQYEELLTGGLQLTLFERKQYSGKLETALMEIISDIPNECVYVQRQLHGSDNIERLTFSIKEIMISIGSDDVPDKDKFDKLENWFWSVGRLVSEKEQAA